jgi:hypothetical protein
MNWLRKLSARFGDEDWVLLTEMPGNQWRFVICGLHPHLVQGKIGTNTEDEAKRVVLGIVKAHLAALGRMSERARLSTLPWRVAARAALDHRRE